MSALRTLALCFLVSASAFSLAALLQTRPELRQNLAVLAGQFDEKIWQPAVQGVRDLALLDTPAFPSGAKVVLTLKAPTPHEERMTAHVDLPPIERPGLTGAVILDTPIEIAPDLPDIPLPPDPPPVTPSRAPARPRVTPRAAEVPRPVPQALAPREQRQPLTREQARARARLMANLTPEMRRHFDLFLFVSKAAECPLAQRMYVFRKDENGLSLLHDWAASTGREKQEISPRGVRSFTGTPAGIYQLDPARMYTRYQSTSWDMPMPHAMFFNWQREGIQTGLAIHAADGDTVAKLGARASAGCVHLAPENARTLFNLVREEYRGRVPRFAVDRNDTMSNQGRFAHNKDGSLKMAAGYRVLVDIENYGGAGDDAIADAMF
jgi:lipoprotein-anchoring transpeptidase ErfK/SrfK